MREGRDPLVRRLASWIPAGTRVLEAGCGSGRVLAFLKEAGARVVGVDFAAGALAESRRRRPDLPVLAGDVTRLPFPDGAFDRVVSLGVVEHFEEGPVAVLREHRRVLAPDGILLLAVPRLTPLKRWRDWREMALGRRREYRSWRGMVVARVGGMERGGTRGSAPARAGSFYQYEVSRPPLEWVLREAGFVPIEVGATSVSLGLRELSPVRAAFRRMVGTGAGAGGPGAQAVGGGPRGRGHRYEWVRRLVVAERGEGPISASAVRALQAVAGHMFFVAARRAPAPVAAGSEVPP